MKSVTAALMDAFRRIGLNPKEYTRFSDPRKPANLTPGYKAVGVKIAFVKFDESIIHRLINDMTARGYHFHYANYNTNRYKGKYGFQSVPGTRFCFSKPETEAAVCAVN